MIRSTGIHSDSWCSIFPHPKEIINRDINNYVPLPPSPRATYRIPLSHVIVEESLGRKEHKYIQVAPYSLCQGTDHLEKIFQDIMDQGGEGIILRDPSAPLQAGRSKGFLKHKVRERLLLSSNRLASAHFAPISEISGC